MRASVANAPSLWNAIAAPSVWALHFLLSYCTAAIVCAKHLDVSIGQIAVALYTVIALLLIATLATRAWRESPARRTAGSEPAEATTGSFLQGLTLLLAGLSALATVYVALPILLFADCR